MFDIEHFGKILDWFGPMVTPTMSNSPGGEREDQFWSKIRKVMKCSWFHGDISTEDAITLLSAQKFPQGTFLVRFSTTNPGSFTISSVSSTSSIKHQRISSTGDGRFTFNGKHYDDLSDIIKDSTDLFIPCPGSKYALLFLDYNAVVASSGYSS